MSLIKDCSKKLARLLFGEYSLYFIYRLSNECSPKNTNNRADLNIHVVDESHLTYADELLRQQVGYMGNESMAFGCSANGQLAGICCYWFGDRYKLRGFWPLAPGEAKLVQIIASPAARGRGIATELIKASAMAMHDAGFSVLYARIWHSNRASIRSFEKAGWLRIAFILEFQPFWATKTKRIHWDLLA